MPTWISFNSLCNTSCSLPAEKSTAVRVLHGCIGFPTTHRVPLLCRSKTRGFSELRTSSLGFLQVALRYELLHVGMKPIAARAEVLSIYLCDRITFSFPRVKAVEFPVTHGGPLISRNQASGFNKLCLTARDFLRLCLRYQLLLAGRDTRISRIQSALVLNLGYLLFSMTES